jgi:DNA-binding ferritin-like protein
MDELTSEADLYAQKDAMTLKSMAAHATLFQNDLKHMHVHAVGEKFAEMHETLQKYYEQAAKEADFFLEQAVIANEGPANPTLAMSNVSEPWSPETKELYEYKDYLQTLWTKGKSYIEIMSSLGDYGRVVSSKLDEFLEFWVSEIEYKLAAQNATELAEFDYEASRAAADVTLTGMFQENYKGKR